MSELTKADLEARLALVRTAITEHLEDGAVTEYSRSEVQWRGEALASMRAEERDLMRRIARRRRGAIRRVVPLG